MIHLLRYLWVRLFSLYVDGERSREGDIVVRVDEKNYPRAEKVLSTYWRYLETDLDEGSPWNYKLIRRRDLPIAGIPLFT